MSNVNKILNKIFYIGDEYKITLPTKEFFVTNLLLLKDKCTKNEIYALIQYKNSYYYHLNGIINNHALPKTLDTNQIGIYDYMLNIFKVNQIMDIKSLTKQLANSYIQFLYGLIDELDSAFTKVSKLNDQILFRSIGEEILSDTYFPYVLPNYKIGDKIFFESFTSCSLNPLITKNFGNVIYVIKIYKEHQIPFIFLSSLFRQENIKKYSQNIRQNIEWRNWKNVNDEFEILLPRNCEFIIKNIRNIKHKDLKIPKKFGNVFNNKNAEKVDYIFYYIESLPYNKPDQFNFPINLPEKILINL